MFDICIWNKCNSRCSMCTNPPGFQDDKNREDYSYKKVVGRLVANKELAESDEPINLTGGEPTIHPRFLDILAAIRDEFPDKKIVIATNGRRFYYPSFVKKVLSFDNISIEIAVHGFDEKSHDKITRVQGSFKQTKRGLYNILRFKNPSQELEVRIILTKQTYKNTSRICNFLYNNFPQIDRLILVFHEIEGIAEENLKLVQTTYSKVKPFVENATKTWRDKFEEMRLYHFPLCTLKPDFWEHTWITQQRDEVVYPDFCEQCRYRDYCCGIHDGVAENSDFSDFSPIKKEVDLEILENDIYHPIRKSAGSL